MGRYVLGRVDLYNGDQNKYAIQRKTVAEVRVDYSFLQQKVGSLEFPGASGVNGYLVGLVVESCWTDGTNGWWFIGRDLTLGTKQAKVDVKSEKTRGMNVSWILLS